MKAYLTVAAVCSILIFVAARAQDDKPGADAGPAPPKPGPEHKVLAKDVGVWDASVEELTPGAPPRVSKGVETNTLACGGLWLISEFKGEMMGKPFEGRGITGYDASKKKYVGTWVDGMTTALGLLEGTHDAAKKTTTFTYRSHEPTGEPVELKMVTVWKDDDTRVWTASVDVEGKDTPVIRISYKRRK
jgi:hypothetical protein